ncbi:MAG: 4-(cytidine 5'-diphospho)-2-C-methyl-D-erythritol kinase [Endomicrobium sp.]|jgi:4-diphosphocytidyl-2-C-methyl-D-erythritol kinase|nr:4-(cytidine 5'-diphospho)-2-C-methyl-D-erythritol kinase [Endomicrobium sp.]
MKSAFKAYAKINLFLEIVGKRQDGYHNLQTIMQTVGLYDELTFERDASGSVSLSVFSADADPQYGVSSLPLDDRNIIVKSAKILQSEFNVKQGVKITLQKNIPIGAGLGGGSSDAAAVLQALVKLWDIKISKNELEKIAVCLGADVPFFLTGGAALCEGIGEIITPLFSQKAGYKEKAFELPEASKNISENTAYCGSKEGLRLPVVLVNPNFCVPTPSVYKKVKFPFTNARKIDKIKNLIETGSLNCENAREVCFNRLEDFVFDDYPIIKEIKQFLTNAGCAALMSGSGATVFGIYNHKDKNKIETELKNRSWKFWFVDTV